MVRHYVHFSQCTLVVNFVANSLFLTRFCEFRFNVTASATDRLHRVKFISKLVNEHPFHEMMPCLSLQLASGLALRRKQKMAASHGSNLRVLFWKTGLQNS